MPANRVAGWQRHQHHPQQLQADMAAEMEAMEEAAAAAAVVVEEEVEAEQEAEAEAAEAEA